MTVSFGPAPALAAAGAAPAVAAKARAAAQDFEAVFLNSMLGEMFSGLGDGPFGGGHAAKTWSTFLNDEYARIFARSGVIGIADSVYKELIAQQEAKAKR